MTLSFKKFVEFVDAPEVTEEQLSEIFGEFSNSKKVDKLRADREALRAKQKGEPKARNAAWARAKNNVGNTTSQKNKGDGSDEEEIDSKLKDKVWMKAKSRIERTPPEFATENKR